MILKNKDFSVGVWDSKLKTPYRWKPTTFRLRFIRDTNEINLVYGTFIKLCLSIEELEDMLGFLKEANKEYLKSYKSKGGKK